MPLGFFSSVNIDADDIILSIAWLSFEIAYRVKFHSNMDSVITVLVKQSIKWFIFLFPTYVNVSFNNQEPPLVHNPRPPPRPLRIEERSRWFTYRCQSCEVAEEQERHDEDLSAEREEGISDLDWMKRRITRNIEGTDKAFEQSEDEMDHSPDVEEPSRRVSILLLFSSVAWSITYLLIMFLLLVGPGNPGRSNQRDDTPNVPALPA